MCSVSIKIEIYVQNNDFEKKLKLYFYLITDPDIEEYFEFASFLLRPRRC